MKPIFIFSLPRSGSTLLQRMLCTSNRISSTSEPWILLPFIYTMKPIGVISDYCHNQMFRAISDFYKGFPNGRDDYLEALREFTLKLYGKRADQKADFFLDKTPRYHLICNEIIEMFPEGKFIFLWRNPLAVVASIINSWTKGKWKIAYYKTDLFDGLSNLIATFKECNHKILGVQYESLLQHPARELGRICRYIGIDYHNRMISSFSQVRLDGSMGDRIGKKQYKQLQPGNIHSWKKTFDNPYRRHWATGYLRWIGSRRLSIMGYDCNTIEKVLRESNGVKVWYMLYDLTTSGIINARSVITLYRRTTKNRWRYIYF